MPKTKSLLVMKLTVLLTTAFLNVGANGLSQTVTFTGKQASLEKVFAVVEHQTGYVFLYTKDMLKDAGTVTLTVHDQPLAQFLETLFANRPIGYQLSVKSILLSRKAIPLPVADAPKPFEEIKGVVRDSEGHPLAGANVMINKTNIGVTTKNDGSFSIDAKAGDVLTISSIGYTAITIKVNPAAQPVMI